MRVFKDWFSALSLCFVYSEAFSDECGKTLKKVSFLHVFYIIKYCISCLDFQEYYLIIIQCLYIGTQSLLYATHDKKLNNNR